MSIFLKRSSSRRATPSRRERGAARGRLSRAPVTANVVMVLPVAHHETPNRRRRGATAAIFYGATSIATVFLNKAIFAVWTFRYPASLVTAQTVFTVFAIVALEQLGVISPNGAKGCVELRAKAFFGGWARCAVFQLKLVLDMKALS